MQPHVDVITLGVADLDRSLAFYRSFGWETDGIVGTEFPGSQTEPAGRAAMFKLRDGLMLSLYPASELAKDAGVDIAAVSGHGFSLGHIVSSRHDVERCWPPRRRLAAIRWERWGASVGHLLRIFPGSRRAPVGSHLLPGKRSELMPKQRP